MAQKRKIFDDETITYNGIFEPNYLYNYICKYFKDKSYDLNELISVVNRKEIVKSQSYIDIRPSKKVSDYVEISFKIALFLFDIEEFVIDSKKMYKGKAKVVIIGFLKSDYQKKYEKGFFWEHIFKPFSENLFLKHVIDDASKILKSDLNSLKEHLRVYFNLDDYEKKALLFKKEK